MARLGVAGPATAGRLSATARAAPRRVRESWWPIVQSGVAAGVAWGIASALFPSQQATFAPFSAIIVLVGSRGGRGKRALRMLAGLLCGVVVGEASLHVLHSGPLQVGLAAVVAMLLVSTVHTDALPLIQSGVAAAIVTASNSGPTGTSRFLDALIGGSIALLMTQVLFTPDPVRMLNAAARDVLGPVGDALRGVAEGLEAADSEPIHGELERLRGVHQPLADFADVGTASRGMAGRTVRGRRKAAQLAAMHERMQALSAFHISVSGLALLGLRLVEGSAAVPSGMPCAVSALADGAAALAEHPEADGGDAAEAACVAARWAEGEFAREVRPAADAVGEAARDLASLAGVDPRADLRRR